MRVSLSVLVSSREEEEEEEGEEKERFDTTIRGASRAITGEG